LKLFIASLLTLASSLSLAQTNARDIVESTMELSRGKTSFAEVTMVIHRPDWQRVMSMQNWTEGTKNSLVRVTTPAKDAGNGSLLKDNNMWSYAPKINRVIKLPSSMMSQSWMGSDLSNKDISKSTDIIDQYEHTLLDSREQDGHTVYVIESVPLENAAIVWGKEVLSIRDDFVLLQQEFWDQDGVLVKSLQTSDIKQMGGRPVATIMRMQQIDKPGQWTEIQVQNVEFDIELSSNLFTLSNLRNPRQ
jgi:outer membrane lipoprotein-sorting protein